MAIVFCSKCQALMYDHKTLKEWLRCEACAFCERKSVEEVSKELNIHMVQKKVVFVSMKDYLGKTDPTTLSKEYLENARILLELVNNLLSKFGEGRKVSSGYRSSSDHLRIYAEINKKRIAQGLPETKVPMGSCHLSCQAVDLEDVDGKLDQWCLDNINEVTSMGLYIENPTATKTWSHLQTRRPGSGSNPFNP